MGFSYTDFHDQEMVAWAWLHVWKCSMFGDLGGISLNLKSDIPRAIVVVLLHF